MTHPDYTKARNKLIPFAVQYANKTEGTHRAFWEGPQNYAKRWNLAFLGEMDRLAIKEGLSVDFSDYKKHKEDPHHKKQPDPLP